LKILSLRQLRLSHLASWKADLAFCWELELADVVPTKRAERICLKADGALLEGNEALHRSEHDRDFKYGTDCASISIEVRK